MINKILSIIFVLGLLIWNPYPLQVLELKTFDWLIMNTEPVQNQQILIVDLDEDFIKENGGWPLPRSVYGDLITTTNAVPGITVLMPNKDIRDDRYDTYFSFRMSKRPTVLALSLIHISEPTRR